MRTDCLCLQRFGKQWSISGCLKTAILNTVSSRTQRKGWTTLRKRRLTATLSCLFSVGVLCSAEITILVNLTYHAINGLHYKTKTSRSLATLTVLDSLYKLERVTKFCLDILGGINITISKMFGARYHNRTHDTSTGRNCARANEEVLWSIQGLWRHFRRLLSTRLKTFKTLENIFPYCF